MVRAQHAKDCPDSFRATEAMRIQQRREEEASNAEERREHHSRKNILLMPFHCILKSFLRTPSEDTNTNTRSPPSKKDPVSAVVSELSTSSLHNTTDKRDNVDHHPPQFSSWDDSISELTMEDDEPAERTLLLLNDTADCNAISYSSSSLYTSNNNNENQPWTTITTNNNHNTLSAATRSNSRCCSQNKEESKKNILPSENRMDDTAITFTTTNSSFSYPQQPNEQQQQEEGKRRTNAAAVVVQPQQHEHLDSNPTARTTEKAPDVSFSRTVCSAAWVVSWIYDDDLEAGSDSSDSSPAVSALLPSLSSSSCCGGEDDGAAAVMNDVVLYDSRLQETTKTTTRKSKTTATGCCCSCSDRTERLLSVRTLIQIAAAATTSLDVKEKHNNNRDQHPTE